MSMTAQKQLGHELIFKMKKNRAFVTGYSRPGRKNPSTPSADQVQTREMCADIVAEWKTKNQEQKDVWNDLAKERNLNMSGFNLFYRETFAEPPLDLEASIHGIREYSNYECGDEEE